MATQTLSIENLGAVPFSGRVQKQIELGLAPLVSSDHLEIDFSGKARGARYSLDFQLRYDWGKGERVGCWFRPLWLGVTGTVAVDAIRRRNYCQDTTKCRTCEPIYRHTADELGRVIGDVAVHEIGHLFGLHDEKSYTGAREGGHTGDTRNPMFIEEFHKDYRTVFEDFPRTKKYTIVAGDTLSEIARRFGFRPPRATWHTLYDFKGKDGKANRDLLRSRNPHLIFPGEQIWIPDYEDRLKYMRALALEDKAFTKSQLDTMKKWLEEGRTLFTVGKTK